MDFVNATFTFGTRISPDPALVGIANLCSTQERLLHKHLAQGGHLDQATKNAVMAKTGLPGRYYNGITTMLEGKHKAVRELTKLQVTEVKERIKQIGKKVLKLRKDAADIAADPKAKHPAKRIGKIELAIHGKKRKAVALGLRLERFQADMAAAVPTLCFGSKNLFRKQFALDENGYRSHDEWLKDWQKARSSQFMIPGSQDETSGNMTCTSTVEFDGTVSIRLLIPEALRVDGRKYAEFRHIRFGYGHGEVVAAIEAATAARPDIQAYQAQTKRNVAALLKANAGLDADELLKRVKEMRQERNNAAKAVRSGHTTALTWRFVRDGTGWTVFVSLHRRLEVMDWGFANGAIGVDLNVGFISIMPVDASGNPLKALARDLAIETSALSSDHAKAVLGEAVKILVQMAVDQRRPIIIELLEFMQKRAALKETCGSNLRRRLSSFAYNLVKQMIHSRAARFGVRVIEVNPAFTSHMGRAKYATPLGISIHHAAAAMIARRGMGLSEGLFASAELPLGDGRHVALPRPVRIGRKHVWVSWGQHFGRYKAARNARMKADKRVRSAEARTVAKAANPASARCEPAFHQAGETLLVASTAARRTAVTTLAV